MKNIFKIAQHYASKEGCQELKITHVKEAVQHVEFLDDKALKLFEKLLNMTIKVTLLYSKEGSWNSSYFDKGFPLSEEVKILVNVLKDEGYNSLANEVYGKNVSFVDDEIARDKKAHGIEVLASFANQTCGEILVACIEDTILEQKKEEIELQMKENLFPCYSISIPSVNVMDGWRNNNISVCNSLQAIGVMDLYLTKHSSNKNYFFIKDGEVVPEPIGPYSW